MLLTENVVSYSIPVGDAWSEVDGLTISLDDRTYDGVKKSESTWNGGLGALTDGHYGLDNFKMDLGNGKGTRAYSILLVATQFVLNPWGISL